MKKLVTLPVLSVLILAGTLAAQEDETAIDPITAEVFADDIIAPNLDVATEVQAAPVPELEPDSLPEAPTEVQTVPVADEVTTDFSAPDAMTVQLSPDATAEEELIYQYDRYLQLMHDGVYDEADSVAKRVVELAIKVKGPRSTDFSKALTNLAIAQHRTGQFDAAQQNFQSAIEIIEENEDRLNDQLVNPLKGLGASQLEAGRPDLAGTTFRRAVHVTHVNEGPHNLEQIEILDSLAETNLRLGSIDDARQVQEMIFALNEHAYEANSLDLVPSLMRRAHWQHRAGLINDQRTTLRRVVRIIEVEASSDDLRLIEPLTDLGKSYFYVDLTGVSTAAYNAVTTGETYFKRALRIASESPEAHWSMIATTSLALGDYYMFTGNAQRANKVYEETWVSLSEGDDRIAYRGEQLERVVTLKQRPLPLYVSAPDSASDVAQEHLFLKGNITIEYGVSNYGRATNLRIIESQPAGFADLERGIQREMRSRLYRPRFVDAEAITSGPVLLIHEFYYRQSDLDAVQATTATAEIDET